MNLFTLTGEILLKGTEEAKEDINEVTNTAERSESKLTSAFKKIGGIVATAFAVDKIKDFGVAIVEASANVSAEMSAFEQIMGSYSDNAQKKLDEVAQSTGVVSTRLTPYMTSLTAKFKGLGNDINESTDLAQRGLYLASDASAFWDKSLDDSMSALNSFINGNYEGGEAIGLFANDTQMASYAVKEGIVSQTKEWANLDEATKQATRLEYAEQMMKLSGATGQASKESGQYANVQANLAEKWRQFKAEIGEPLLQNVVIPAMNGLMGVVDNLSAGWEKLQTWVKNNKEEIDRWVDTLILGTVVVGAYILAMGMMSIIQTVTKWIKLMATGQATLNAVMALNPVGAVVAVLALLVVAFIKGYNESEKFRTIVNNVASAVKTAWTATINWFKNLPNTFKNIWNSVRTATVNTWNSIRSTVTTIVTNFINGVKNNFNSFKTAIVNIWNSIKTSASNSWNSIKTSVVNITTSFINSIKTKFENFRNTTSTIWNNIKNAIVDGIKNLPENLKTIGKDIVEGLWNGINNSVTWITDKISGFGKTVTDKFKSIFKTHSPSEITTEIGEDVGKGIGVGIGNSEGDVLSSAENIGDGLFDVFGHLEELLSQSPIGRRIGKALGFEFAEAIEESIPEAEKATEGLTKVVEDTAPVVEKKLTDTFKAINEKVKSIASNMQTQLFNATSYFSSMFNSSAELKDAEYDAKAKAIQEELDGLSEATEEKIALAQEEHDRNVELVKDEYEQGLISANEYFERKKAFDNQLNAYEDQQRKLEKQEEEKLNKEKNDILKKQFEAKKETDKANVWINLATAIMKAYAELGFIGGTIASIALGVTARNQIKSINAQKYTPFAEGGIVDEPTRGLVGEDGKEAIVPLERNTEWVGGLAKAISPAILTAKTSDSSDIRDLREELQDIKVMLSEYLTQLVNKNTDIVLDGNRLAYALAPSIDNSLGDINKLRMRGI